MRDAAARRALRSPDTFVSFPAGDCDQALTQAFEQQAAARPDAVAVFLDSAEVTYAQLNAAANRTARHLRTTITAADAPIALLMHQGYESIVWTLAILKAGRCYAPLDQRLPVSVLRAMVDDLGPAALVADDRYVDLAHTLAAKRVPVVAAQADLVGGEPHADGNLDRAGSPDAIAYVFYTSGSTGRPKGVADSHRHVLHNVLRYTNTLCFAPGDRLSLVQNPSFSGTVSTLFGGLLNGAAVAPFDLLGEGLSTLSDWTRRSRITVFHAVPSIFRELADPVERFPALRLVRLEGDRVSAQDLEHFHATVRDDCTLVNGLGATECGLVRQFFVDRHTTVSASEPVPIGYPVADVAVRIVDGEGWDLPANDLGEIVVESPFLATGYWRNPELTAARFTVTADGRRRYHTGDLGRMEPDGCLVHFGRIDHRIRIAGEFIDTVGIESVLLAAQGVDQAVVHDYVDQTGERKLCAYIVRVGPSVTAEGLRDVLVERLGRHAIPTTFLFVDALPLTNDRKIDRRRLPLPGRSRPELPNAFVAPRTALEKQMAQIWSEVLEIDPVGVTDSLFALGGDSLRAARITNRLRPMCGERMRITSLFEHPTIRALAHAMQQEDLTMSGDRSAVVDRALEPDHRVAVIGMACRFPGAETLDQFWTNIRAGREGITFFPAVEGAAQDQSHDAPLVPARGLLDDVDRFDAPLFGLTPRQADMLDPQQRIWLECVYRALEDAGIPVGGSDRTSADLGVFAGGRESTYLWHLIGGNRAAVEALLNGDSNDALELLNSNDRDAIATRTSFLFGCTGPAITVQAACSTSLVAVAQACDALSRGQCSAAIAGGVAVSFPQRRGHRYMAGGMYSRDGHCRPFDADASGTVFSDGAGVVVLKRLDRAMADGDRIEAVIRGWAVNNDGSNKASFAAPSVEGQARVIAQAQDHAGVRAREISYIEAHGTGTPVGDPIEFTALERAFRRDTDARQFCGIGSVKSNIGHVDTAAGIAGLIKTILALKHRELPPTLHYRTPNPEIAFDASPFYVVDRLQPWTSPSGRRTAGVSSLGVGGTNCHVIVEEAPPVSDAITDAPIACLVPFSAASASALNALEASYGVFLSNPGCPDLAQIAATVQRSRAHHSHRLAIRCANLAQLRATLCDTDGEHTAGAPGSDMPSRAVRWQGFAQPATAPRIAFLFAGQGSQHVGMGQALFDTCPEFRRQMERCAQVLQGHMRVPLLEVVFADAVNASLIHQTEFAQPALFALEYCLADLLRSWGIQPYLVLGHSLGEYVAACFAGVFTVEEGLALAAARGRLMQALPASGAMLAVSAPAVDLEEMLRDVGRGVSIAAINSPTQTVLSGHRHSLDRLAAALRARGRDARLLAVSHGFHSSDIEPVMPPLEELLARARLQSPTVRLLSNVSGRVVTDEVTDPRYWSAHARHTVRFAACLETLIDEGCDLVVEIGPDGMLSQLTREVDSQRRLTTIATLRRGEHDWTALLDALGQLYVGGARVDWTAFQSGRTTRPVRVPGHPFQRARRWYHGALVASSTREDRIESHPLLGRRLVLPGSAEIRFETRFSQTTPHFLGDHRLFGVSLPPAASHLSMLAQAATVLAKDHDAGRSTIRFDTVHLLRPLLLPDGCEREVQLIIRTERFGWSIELMSAKVGDDSTAASAWTTHMDGRALVEADTAEPEFRWDLDAIRARCSLQVSGAEFYTKIWANHGGTGSSFRWIDSICYGEREAICRAVSPSGIGRLSEYRLHPGLIEAACQVLHCCGDIETAEALEGLGVTFVPFSVDVFTLHDVAVTHHEAWCHARLIELTRKDVVADLTILTSSGQVMASVKGFCLRQITRDAIIGATESVERRLPDVPPVAGSRRDAPLIPQPIGIEDTARYLQRQCAELSGVVVADISLDVRFTDLGLDSIAAMRLSNHLARDLGVTVTLRQILTCDSLNRLAESLDDAARHGGAVSKPGHAPIGRVEPRRRSDSAT